MKKLLFSLAFLALTAHAQKWDYDFIVPDNGSFDEAIQAANKRCDKETRFRIFVKAGNYVTVGDDDTLKTTVDGKDIRFKSPIVTLSAPNTSIIGEDYNSTCIENRPTYEGIGITSTIFLKGCDNTYIQDLQFYCHLINNANPFAGRAVALNERNCKNNVFKNVFLNSTQDTYWTNDGGNTYLQNCKIAGTVDFICGGGTIFFDNCDIILVKRQNYEKGDIITAPATPENQQYGYVFSKCKILPQDGENVKFHLGRPWKFKPKVEFIDCQFFTLPLPEGWTNMHGTIPGRFGEYNSIDKDGKTLDLSQRRTVFEGTDKKLVKIDYNPVIQEEELERFNINNVFNGWNPRDIAQQIDPPTLTAKNNMLKWADIPNAGTYAVYMNNKIIAFTKQNQFKINNPSASSIFYIRAANQMGGLGKPSNSITL